ncbi:hypothetical protein RF11_11602 [Thelohanellus kitauei]|uniref:Uncharacterized protein n=1 Tax=Thelohanellus kitauei TaxID=669202 RepID=A0A0C2J9V8_THEKT|nr:hypothetical protein RF11_11602 [Thelohanellus kitauei]
MKKLTTKSTFFLISLLNLILAFINGEGKAGTKLYALSFGTMNINVEINVNLDYLSSKYLDHKFRYDMHSYKMSDIKKFNIESNELGIIFENKRAGSWLLIDCFLEELQTQIEIAGCRLLFRRSEIANLTNMYVGHTFYLNKDTKYIFSNHYISCFIGGKIDHMIMFAIYDLIITFEGYTQKYNWKIDKYGPTFVELTSTLKNIYFEDLGGEYSVEIEPSIQLQNDEHLMQTEAQVYIDENPDNMTNDLQQIESNNNTNRNNEILDDDDIKQGDDMHESDVLEDHNETYSHVDMQESEETLLNNETNEQNDTEVITESHAIDETHEDNKTKIKIKKRRFDKLYQYFKGQNYWISVFVSENYYGIIFLFLSAVIISVLIYSITRDFRNTKNNLKAK